MENLALHIEYLLLRHDCVVLPGLGAFINVYEAPVFDFKAGVITPMRREVRFNPVLRTDDGILANSYARKNAVSFREGSTMMTQAISLLSDTLLLDGEATVGRLGIIRREAEGNLRFLPFKSAERIARDMGICKIHLKKNEEEEADSFESQRIRETSPFGNPATPETVAAGTESEGETSAAKTDSLDSRIRKMDFERNYYIPVNKIFAKACACLLVIAIFALTYFIPTSEKNKTEERASVMPIEKIIDTAIQQTKNISDALSKSKTNGSEELREPEETDPAEEKPADGILPSLPYSEVDSDSYFLIVATCTTCDEAMKFAAHHVAAGYDLQVVESTKKCRVSAATSKDRGKLLEIMRSQEFKKLFPEAWIWKK